MKANGKLLAALFLVLATTPGVLPAQEPKPDQSSEPQRQAYEAQFRDQLLFSRIVNQRTDGGTLLSLAFTNALVSSNDLGVDVAEIQPSLRAQLGIGEGVGLVITSVPDDSPGAKGGLKPHDVLVKVGSTAVGSTEQLAESLQAADGKPVQVEVIRQGKAMTAEVTPNKVQVAEVVLKDMPITWYDRVNVTQQERYRIGVVLSEADDTLRAQVGLAAGEGLIVTEVFPDAPAAKAGIAVHDVLVILDGKRLSTVDAVNGQIQEIKEREVDLKLLRGGKEVTLKIAPAKEAVASFAEIDRQALTVFRCPGQVQSHNCNSCHQDPYADAVVGTYHGHEVLRRWIAQQPANAGSPQEQVNQLKEQLAKMQETLAQLEVKLAGAEAKNSDGKKQQEGKAD